MDIFELSGKWETICSWNLCTTIKGLHSQYTIQRGRAVGDQFSISISFCTWNWTFRPNCRWSEEALNKKVRIEKSSRTTESAPRTTESAPVRHVFSVWGKGIYCTITLGHTRKHLLMGHKSCRNLVCHPPLPLAYLKVARKHQNLPHSGYYLLLSIYTRQ